MSSHSEILFSRQALLFAEADTLQVLQTSSVLIINPNVTGCEIARNLGLAGVDKIYFTFDNSKTNSEQILKDYKKQYLNETLTQKILNVTFKFSEEDNNPEEWNSSILTLINSIMVTETLKVVVICDNGNLNSVKLNCWNEICRKHSIPLIITQSCGLLAYIFVDVGENYTYNTISDVRAKKVIRKIDIKTRIIEVADQRHQFSPESYVKFSDMNGSQALVNHSPFIVDEFISPNQFSIKIDPKLQEEFENSPSTCGCVEEVERPFNISHVSLKDNLIEPKLESPYISKRNRNALFIFKYFNALSKFKCLNNDKLPRLRNEEDFNLFHQLFGKEFDSEDLDKLKISIYQTMGIVPAMTNIIGGIIAQEILKILHHSFQPISQWLLFDSLSSLPSNYLSLDPSNFVVSENEKNGYLIEFFGREVQKKLAERKILLVGAGALGCEYLKLFSAMGVSSSYSDGRIYLCDSDNINESNLHRQFLFAKEDVGKSKAKTACYRMNKIDPDLNIIPFTTQLTLTTILNTFTDQAIWRDITEVFSAVDTVNAREIMDKLSYSHKKLFLESGTHGNVCNTTIYIPSVTSRYKVYPDPENETNCLGKEFPFRPRHTVSWAKELFKFYFFRAIVIFNEVRLSSPQTAGSGIIDYNMDCFFTQLNSLLELHKLLLQTNGAFENNGRDEIMTKIKLNSLIIANSLYNLLFEKIKSMQNQHPIDDLDENGEKFWSGYKIFPKLLNESDEESLKLKDEFMESIQLLLENIFANIKNDSQALIPQKFNKDNELHIKYIYSTSNLYSKCFGIPLISKIQAQILGGEIIPAIITISCICVGLVGLELYKLLDYSPPCNTSNVIKYPLREKKLGEHGEFQSSDLDSDKTLSSVVSKLRDHSYNSNANHFQEFEPRILDEYSFDDHINPRRILDNLIIIQSDDNNIKFSQIVELINRKYNIKILRIFNSQFKLGESNYDILYPPIDPDQAETTVLQLLSEIGRFSCSSFFFETEYCTEEFGEEYSIDVFLQFLNL